MTELAKHIAQRVMQFLVADPDRITHSIEEVAEIIDSDGVRELTEQEAALRKSLEEERTKVAQRNSVIVGKGEDNMRLHLQVRELTEALDQAKLTFFFVRNLSHDAWRDPPNLEAICKRIEDYGKMEYDLIEAVLARIKGGQ